jgi:hypothetical protein
VVIPFAIGKSETFGPRTSKRSGKNSFLMIYHNHIDLNQYSVIVGTID